MRNVIHHNPYCAKCNNRANHPITCRDPVRASVVTPISPIRVQPLSILFNPNLLQRYLRSDTGRNSTTRRIYSLAYHCRKSDGLYHLMWRKCSSLTKSRQETILLMKCSYLVQTLETYHQYSNGSLYLIHRSILLSRNQYILLTDQQILFCADQWKPKRFLRFSSYRYILSVICSSIDE